MNNLENQEIINTHNISFRYGAIAGILMAVVLMLFSMSGNDFSPFLKLSKYLPLAMVIIVALNIYKSKVNSNIFIKGIGIGAKLSIIAGAILALINLVLFLIQPEWSFSKYGIDPTSLERMIMVSAILFFETFVFGNIISFAILQYLKDRIKI